MELLVSISVFLKIYTLLNSNTEACVISASELSLLYQRNSRLFPEIATFFSTAFINME